MRKSLSNWYVYLVVLIVLTEEAVFWLRARPTLLLLLTAVCFSLTVVAIAYATGVTFP